MSALRPVRCCGQDRFTYFCPNCGSKLRDTRKRKLETGETIIGIVYGYTRKSPSGREDTGRSIEAQRATITEYFEKQLKPRGYTWGGFFEDAAETSWTPLPGRPAGMELCNRAKRGDVIISSHFDRVFRSMPESAHLIDLWAQRGVGLVEISTGMDMTTPNGRFVAGIRAMMGEHERRMISIRTKEEKAIARAKGLRIGNCPPLGYMHKKIGDKTYVVVDPEFIKLAVRIIELDVHWPHRGAFELQRQIEKELAEAEGRPFRPVTDMAPVSAWTAKFSTFPFRSRRKLAHKWYEEGKLPIKPPGMSTTQKIESNHPEQGSASLPPPSENGHTDCTQAPTGLPLQTS